MSQIGKTKLPSETSVDRVEPSSGVRIINRTIRIILCQKSYLKTYMALQ